MFAIIVEWLFKETSVIWVERERVTLLKVENEFSVKPALSSYGRTL